MHLLPLALSLSLLATTSFATITRGPPAGTIISTCTKPNTIALTFDDGPSQYLDTLLAVLKKERVKATFFVTGIVYGCIYDEPRATNLKRAFKAGHQIAHHTWSHPNLAELNTTSITTEMTKLDGALVNLLGVKPTYMRPPFISFNSEVVDVMTKMGYRIVNCDVDSQDWNNLTPEESLARVEAAGRATADGQGHVLLMHDPIESTSKELALMVIKWAKANKLKMVTVAECLGDHLPYTRGKGTKERTC